MRKWTLWPWCPFGIEHVGGEIAALVVRRRRERRDGVVDPVALRVDVPGHVERVRNVRHELGVAPAGVPGALGRLAAFVAVNQVVVRAEVVVVSRHDLLEERDALERVGARLLRDRIVAIEERQPQDRARFFIVRIRRDELAHAGDVVEVRRLRRRIAARPLRLDIEALACGHLVAQRHRLFRGFARANHRAQRGAVGASGNGRRLGPRGFRCGGPSALARIADQLEGGAIVAAGAQGDAPVGHRHVRVERRRLQERSFRFEEPERVHLRDALVEELARLLRGGRHRHVGDAHALHEAGRQHGLGAWRDGAQVRLGPHLRRSGRRDTQESSADEAGNGHAAKYSPPAASPAADRQWAVLYIMFIKHNY